MAAFTNNIFIDEGTIYSCDVNSTSTIVIGLSITNTHTTSLKISLIHHTGSDSVYILKDVDLASNETIVPIGHNHKLILKTGGYLELTSNYTGSDYLTSAISILNILSPFYSYPEPIIPTPSYFGDIGIFGGGYSSYKDAIEKVVIAIDSNAAYFSDLTIARYGAAGMSNGTVGMFGGGHSGAVQKIIDQIILSIEVNATWWGDLPETEYGMGSCSDGTIGLFCTGYAYELKTHEITFSNSAFTQFFGNVTGGRGHCASVSDGTYAVIAGGYSTKNVIDYFTFATQADAVDFGVLTAGRHYISGSSNGTRGVFGGGNTSNTTIDYITIAVVSDATDFGDLTQGRYGQTSCSDGTIGLWAGGVTYNIIDKVTIDTTANATDFGDLTESKYYMGALSGN